MKPTAVYWGATPQLWRYEQAMPVCSYVCTVLPVNHVFSVQSLDADWKWQCKVDNTGSPLIITVNQSWVWLVLGWVTARECHVVLAPSSCDCTLASLPEIRRLCKCLSRKGCPKDQTRTVKMPGLLQCLPVMFNHFVCSPVKYICWFNC